MKYIAIILAITLQGCSTIEYQKEYIDLPPELLVRCAEIQEVTKGEMPLGDFVKYTIKVLEQYNICAQRMDKVIESNAKLKNTK